MKSQVVWFHGQLISGAEKVQAQCEYTREYQWQWNCFGRRWNVHHSCWFLPKASWWNTCDSGRGRHIAHYPAHGWIAATMSAYFSISPFLLNFATAYPWPLDDLFLILASCYRWQSRRILLALISVKLGGVSQKIRCFSNFDAKCVLWFLRLSSLVVSRRKQRWIGIKISFMDYGLWRILMLFWFLFHLSEAVASSLESVSPFQKRISQIPPGILFGIDAREPRSWRHVWLIHSIKL